QFTTQNFENIGSVTPASLPLAPGQSGTFTVNANAPAQPGDLDASVVFSSAQASATAPLTLRGLVRLNADGGTFAGVLQGGNGRSANNSQQDSFQFDVPGGKKFLNLSLSLRDPNYRATGFLVAPSGEALDIQTNGVGTRMQFFERAPDKGRWTLVIRLSRGI